jgi:hypothetical protein
MTDINSTRNIREEILTNAELSLAKTSPKTSTGEAGIRYGKDGIVRMRIGRPRNAHRTFRPTDQYYDLKFLNGRRYKVIFTSMSDPNVAFEKDFVATSLKKLLSEVAYFIGQTRKPRAARRFSVTFEGQLD